MPFEFNDPVYWFDRAEEMRVGADRMPDPGNKEIMLRISADYERLGQRAHTRRAEGAAQSPNRE